MRKETCVDLATDRMRYFTGRYMTARDFRDEQSYHLAWRRLHNRILHGWGVACGLHVHPHPLPDCRPTHVVVDCGMAVDCCGREIVVPRAIASPPLDWSRMHRGHAGDEDAAQQDQAQEQEQGQGQGQEQAQDQQQAQGRYHDRRWYALLCLEYCETEIEKVPVLYSEQSCDKARAEYSRVRESFKLTWRRVRYRDLTAKYFWKTLGGGGGACDDDKKDEHHCCLEPQCPPHHCVPLAVISAQPGSPIDREDIDTIGRPSLEPPVQSLTHITAINWPHGGVVSRGELERRLQRLEIRFDRPLKKHHGRPSPAGPYGVNPATFVVQYGGGAENEDLDFVPFRHPPHVEHDCVAVFSMDASRRRHDYSPYAYLEHHTVYVTLKCDFILDCHGDPVDGNHLGGVLPSGDGVRGGAFESWFSVLPDPDYDRYRDAAQQEQRP